MALAILIALLVGFFIFLWQQLKRPHNYPPGPRWLPLLGNGAALRRITRQKGSQHAGMAALMAEHRTPVLGLKLGGDLVVVVASHKLVHQVLTREEFDGRPDSFFIKLRCMGTRRGVTCVDGALWREQRSFVVRHLRQLGLGKLSMETSVLDELCELRESLYSSGDGGVRPGTLLAPSVMNVLWSMVAGARFEKDDQRLRELIALLGARGKAFDMAGGLLNQLPWLRFLAPERTGFTLLNKINTDLARFVMESIESHRQQLQPDVTRDLIDAFLHQMNEDKSENSTFTEAQLVMVCLDMFIGGALTTSNTLDFVFLMMLHHPDVQRRVQQELDAVVGRTRLPQYSDITKLPYTEAVLMEVQRLHHVAPVIGPRRVLKNTTLQGYDIPKNTTVLMSVWSIHMDEAHWGDPHNFRPERFLNEHGELVKDDWLMPFGLGRRKCLADVLAKSCIFLFFAGILQKFNVTPLPNCDLPTTTPMPGMTLAPTPYQAVFTPRPEF